MTMNSEALWFEAAKNDDLSALSELQMFKKYDSVFSVNGRYQGWAAIHYAAFHGSVNAIKYLIPQEGGLITINSNFPWRLLNKTTEVAAGSSFIHILILQNHDALLQDVINILSSEQLKYVATTADKRGQTIFGLGKQLKNNAAKVLFLQEKMKQCIGTNIQHSIVKKQDLYHYAVYDTEIELNDGRVFRFEVRNPQLEQLITDDFVFTGVKGIDTFGSGVVEFKKAKTIVNFVGNITSITNCQINGIGEMKTLGRHVENGQMTCLKIGTFKNSMLSGAGELHVNNYASFYGAFIEDKLHGPVSICYANGHHVIQIFNNGVPGIISECQYNDVKVKYYDNSGTFGSKITSNYSYEGEIYKNSCHGRGKRVYNNGQIQQGQFLFEEFVQNPNQFNIEVGYLQGIKDGNMQQRFSHQIKYNDKQLSPSDNLINRSQCDGTIVFKEDQVVKEANRNDLDFRFAKICQKLKNNRNMQQFFVMISNLRTVASYYKPQMDDIRDQLQKEQFQQRSQFDVKFDQTKDQNFEYDEQKLLTLVGNFQMDYNYQQSTQFKIDAQDQSLDIFFEQQTLINDSNEQDALSIFVNYLIKEISLGKRRLEVQFKFALTQLKQDKQLNVYLKLLETAFQKVECITNCQFSNPNKWISGGFIYLVSFIQGTQIKPCFEKASIDMSRVLPDQQGIKYDLFTISSNTKIKLIPHVNRFYSQQLKDYELQALIDVINGLADLQENIIIQTPMPQKHFDRFQEALKYDFPELFMNYTLDYKYNSFKELYKVQVKYALSQKDILSMITVIDAAAQKCMNEIETYLKSNTDKVVIDKYYEVEKIIIQFMLRQVKTGGSGSDAASIQGAFASAVEQSSGLRKINHEGFAKTFQYLCMQANLPNIIVYGLMKKAQHCWNVVFFGSQWYNVDLERVTQTDLRFVNYNDDYSELKQRVRSKKFLELPARCMSMDYFFYQKEGYYVDSANKKSMTVIKQKKIFALFADGVSTARCQFYYKDQPDIKDFRDEVYAAVARVSKQLNRQIVQCTMVPVENEIIQLAVALSPEVQGDYEVLSPDVLNFLFNKPLIDKRPLEFNKFARFVFDAAVYRKLASKMTVTQFTALQDIIRQVEFCNPVVNFRIPVTPKDLEVVQLILELDFPEYFFGTAAALNKMNDLVYSIKIKGMLTLSPQQIMDMQNKLVLWRNKIRNDIIVGNLDATGAEKYIQNWLADNVKAGKGTFAKTAYGAIIDRACLPLGRIQAFNYIAQEIGIPCLEIPISEHEE